MKPRSEKHAAIVRKYGPLREAYVREIGTCFCGQPAVECHEITSGPDRMKGYKDRTAWLALCRRCHEIVQGWPAEAKAAQYILKAKQDREEFYDRVGLNIMRAKAADAISEYDVIWAYETAREILG